MNNEETKSRIMNKDETKHQISVIYEGICEYFDDIIDCWESLEKLDEVYHTIETKKTELLKIIKAIFRAIEKPPINKYLLADINLLLAEERVKKYNSELINKNNFHYKFCYSTWNRFGDLKYCFSVECMNQILSVTADIRFLCAQFTELIQKHARK